MGMAMQGWLTRRGLAAALPSLRHLPSHLQVSLAACVLLARESVSESTQHESQSVCHGSVSHSLRVAFCKVRKSTACPKERYRVGIHIGAY